MALAFAAAGCGSAQPPAPEPTPEATPTAVPGATPNVVREGSLSFEIPPGWVYRKVDGDDFTVLILSTASGQITALGLLVTSPAARRSPDYRNEQQQQFTVDGVTGVIMRGIVPGRTTLNDYLGRWAGVPAPTRPNFDIHVAEPGQAEWRFMAQARGGPRFEIAMSIDDEADRAVFGDILRTLKLPRGP